MVNWRVLTESVRGASHLRNGLPNQDFVDKADNPLVIAVADGHGSARCPHSDLGAKFAVEVAIDTIQSTFNKPDLSLPALKTLAENIPISIHRNWKEKVDAYIEQEGLTFEESPNNQYLAFGTTLLATTIYGNHLLFWQIGDGDVVIIQSDDTLCNPIPQDERLLGNDTTSLCRKEAEKDFRIKVMPMIEDKTPKAIFLVTDGYKNSFKYTDGFHEALNDIYSFIGSEGEDFVKDELASWLNEASQKGSGDDISLAVIYVVK